MRKSLLLLLFAALFAGCNTNEPDNTTTPTENTVNTGDDKSDYVEQHVWNDTVSIVWNGASATLRRSQNAASKSICTKAHGVGMRRRTGRLRCRPS